MSKKMTFRCSSLYQLTRLDGASVLTDKQAGKLPILEAKKIEYESKGKKLSATDTKELNNLIAKRDAKPKLSQGAKTEVEKLFYQEKYGFRKNYSNKFTEKGINQENEGINEVVKFLGLPMVFKNEKRYYNNWINGEPDTVLKALNFQMDLKNVYYPDGLDFFDDVVDPIYEWQQHGYNWLTGVDNSIVAKVLLNPKGDVLEKEIYSIAKEAKAFPITESFRKECIEYLDFERFPIEDRVNLYTIKTEQHHIETIKQGVNLSREYWDELEIKFNNKNKVELNNIITFNKTI